MSDLWSAVSGLFGGQEEPSKQDISPAPLREDQDPPRPVSPRDEFSGRDRCGVPFASCGRQGTYCGVPNVTEWCEDEEPEKVEQVQLVTQVPCTGGAQLRELEAQIADIMRQKEVEDWNPGFNRRTRQLASPHKMGSGAAASIAPRADEKNAQALPLEADKDGSSVLSFAEDDCSESVAVAPPLLPPAEQAHQLSDSGEMNEEEARAASIPRESVTKTPSEEAEDFAAQPEDLPLHEEEVARYENALSTSAMKHEEASLVAATQLPEHYLSMFEDVPMDEDASELQALQNGNLHNWRQVRANLLAGAALGTVLNGVRCRDDEHLYEQDWNRQNAQRPRSSKWHKVKVSLHANAVLRSLLDDVRRRHQEEMYEGGDWNRSGNVQNWRKVRASIDASAALGSLLNDVRSRHDEELYEGDWTSTCNLQSWRRVRASIDVNAALGSVLNDVRSRQHEQLYELDWNGADTDATTGTDSCNGSDHDESTGEDSADQRMLPLRPPVAAEVRSKSHSDVAAAAPVLLGIPRCGNKKQYVQEWV